MTIGQKDRETWILTDVGHTKSWRIILPQADISGLALRNAAETVFSLSLNRFIKYSTHVLLLYIKGKSLRNQQDLLGQVSRLRKREGQKYVNFYVQKLQNKSNIEKHIMNNFRTFLELFQNNFITL